MKHSLVSIWTSIIVLVLLLLVVPLASAKHLYCSMPTDTHVYHFSVSIHPLDGFVDADLPDDSGFNYLDISNYVEVGPSDTPGYTEYKVMDVSFLKDDVQYRVTIIPAITMIDFRDAPKVGRWVYGYGGVSEPLYVNAVPSIDGLQILEIR